MKLPVFSDVQQAARRLAGFGVRTPLLQHPELNQRCSGRLFIKPECLQRTGSFKFRGAWNRISQLDKAEHPGGVVAYSSGNHAQGVAAAAQIKGLPAVIVMPRDTPAIKIANTRNLGAETVLYERGIEDRKAIAEEIARKRGAVIVPPFDDPDIVAGQGTAGLELIEDVSALGEKLDHVVVCCGGGGLTAGIALACETLMPECAVYCAEPAGFDDWARSLASGERQKNAQTTGSICDALLSPCPGELTFAINHPRVKGGLVVSDEEVKAAMRFAFTRLKLVVEPGGAVALAAVLSGKLDCRDKSTAVILSGGNADADLFSSVLSEAA